MAKLTDLWVNIGAKTDGLKKGLGEAKGEVQGFQREVSKLPGLITGAFSVAVIVAFSKQCSQLALGVDEIKYAFDRINNPNLLSNLRKATEGTVTDVNLMKQAVRANSLGIPIQQLGTYFEFAKRQAGALGMSTDQVTEAIVNGIGNKATRAFRQLGVSSIEVNKAFADIEPELLSVEEVSARAFLMINEKLKEMGPNVDFASDAIERQAAAWENVKTKFGEFINNVKAAWSPIIMRLFNGQGFIPNPQLSGSDAFDAKLKAWNDERAKEANDQTIRDAQKVIDEGKIKKAAEDAAKAKKKATKEYNDALKDLDSTMSKVKVYPYTAPGVPAETKPEDTGFGQPDLWSKTENNLSSLPGPIDKVKSAFDDAKISASEFANQVLYLGSTADDLKSFAKEAGNAARQFIASQIASGIATIIEKTFASTKNPWLGIVLGGVAGGLAAGVFNSAIPKFAKGGMTNGPQLAMIGDNPSGKELVIPSEQWGKLGQNITLTARIGHREIWLSNKMYGEHLTRTT